LSARTAGAAVSFCKRLTSHGRYRSERRSARKRGHGRRARRAGLYTGKLLGHLVTLKYGDETQPVIAKDVQFHPVTDVPVHFDLYRVDEHQAIKIAVPVHFKNQDVSPGIKRGGALNIAFHEVEILVEADHIPEEIVVDLEGLDIGASIHASDLVLPKGVKLSTPEAAVIATLVGTSAQASEDAAAEAAAAEAASTTV